MRYSAYGDVKTSDATAVRHSTGGAVGFVRRVHPQQSLKSVTGYGVSGLRLRRYAPHKGPAVTTSGMRAGMPSLRCVALCLLHGGTQVGCGSNTMSHGEPREQYCRKVAAPFVFECPKYATARNMRFARRQYAT